MFIDAEDRGSVVVEALIDGHKEASRVVCVRVFVRLVPFILCSSGIELRRQRHGLFPALLSDYSK